MAYPDFFSFLRVAKSFLFSFLGVAKSFFFLEKKMGGQILDGVDGGVVYGY